MIGPQKRSLGSLLSTNPLKYQKHSDEANPGVASLTGMQLEFQKYLHASSQERIVSPISDWDSTKAIETRRSLVVPRKGNDISEPENGACGASHEGLIFSKEYRTFRTAHQLCAGTSEEAVMDAEQDPRHFIIGACRGSHVGRIVSKGCGTFRPTDQLRADDSNEIGLNAEQDKRHSYEEAPGLRCSVQWNPELVRPSLVRSADDSALSRSGAALGRKRLKNSWNRPGSNTRGMSPVPADRLLSLRQGLLNQRRMDTSDKSMEGDSCFGSGQKTVEALLANCSQPLPVLMSEKIIDLFLMGERVQRCGGYDLVTSEGLWGNISEALGLESNCGPGLKLIYFKYLKNLQRDSGPLSENYCQSDVMDAVNVRGTVMSCERRFVNLKAENDGPMIGEQFAESEPFSQKPAEKATYGSSSSVRPCKHDDAHIDNQFERASMKSECVVEMFNPYNRLGRDHGKHFFHRNCCLSRGSEDIPVFVCPGYRFLKGCSDQHSTWVAKSGTELNSYFEGGRMVARKSEFLKGSKSLADTLSWMKRMAVEVGNPQMGKGLAGTDQNEHWVTDCVSRAWKIRSLLWGRRDECKRGDEHAQQIKQTVTPSLSCEDLSRLEEQPTLERLRVTRERVACYGSASAQNSAHESLNGHKGLHASPSQSQWPGQSSQRLPRQSHFYNEERYFEDSLLSRPRKRVPIGGNYQVCVPSKCSAVPSSPIAGSGGRPSSRRDDAHAGNGLEDDSRWLGKQVWPPPGVQRFSCNSSLGHYRASICSCLYPDSIDCTRSHILEERDRLKQELGQAFYCWEFDQIGESVADEWTKDEEHLYRVVVKMNPPSQDKNFWDQLPEVFPGKTMTKLVSYYFNVFVLRRRAIQNRLQAKQVDSDDDETELPNVTSEDSEEYDSEGADGDTSDGGEEVDKADEAYGGHTSAKMLEVTGFSDHVRNRVSSGTAGFNNLEPRVGASKTFSSTHEVDFNDDQHPYCTPIQDGSVRLFAAHISSTWGREQPGDEKKLEDHVSVVGEEELQEVKTWELSHWEEGHHEELEEDETAKLFSTRDEQLALSVERDLSPYKKIVEAINHQNTLGNCDGEVWDVSMEIPSMNERDKLLSTTGMIQEFFGNGGSDFNT